MALPGELKGLDGTTCMDCGAQLTLTVLRSAAGYYLGYWCSCCGPYSRETGYFSNRGEAKVALDAYSKEGTVPANVRDTAHHLGSFEVREWDPSQALLGPEAPFEEVP